MPRVLYVIHGPTFGGAHVQVQRLRIPLKARGWDCEVVLPTEPGNAVDRLREADLDVVAMSLHRLRATKDPRTHARMLAGFRSEVRAIRGLIRERAIDVVQVHGPTNPHGALAAHAEGVAVVWQLLDLTAPPPLRRLAMRAVIHLADAITAYGEAVSIAHPGTRKLGDRLVHVVPPVDPADFDLAIRPAARRLLGIPEGTCAIGTVGIRTPEKAHLDLVRAVAGVREQAPDAVLRVIGGPSRVHGHYEKLVRAEAAASGLGDQSAFQFVDPRGRVAELLPAIDVFAMTSRAEGMPTAVLEAMICGLPVVGADVGAVGELVEDGVTGFLVSRGDHAATVRALLDLTRDRELRIRMGAAGRRRALEHFGLEGVADAHVRAFEIALEHRRSRS